MTQVIKDQPPIVVTTSQEGDDVVLTVSGELDPHSAPELGRYLSDADASVVGKVILDMAGVEFIDSSGLRVLIEAQQRLEGAGRALAVRNPSEATARLLRITGLDEHVEQG